jgi:hypothetical protein
VNAETLVAVPDTFRPGPDSECRHPHQRWSGHRRGDPARQLEGRGQRSDAAALRPLRGLDSRRAVLALGGRREAGVQLHMPAPLAGLRPGDNNSFEVVKCSIDAPIGLGPELRQTIGRTGSAGSPTSTQGGQPMSKLSEVIEEARLRRRAAGVPEPMMRHRRSARSALKQSQPAGSWWMVLGVVAPSPSCR